MNNENGRRFGTLEIVFILMASAYLIYAISAGQNNEPQSTVLVITATPSSTPEVDPTVAETLAPPGPTITPSPVSPDALTDPLERAARFAEFGDNASAVVEYTTILRDRPEDMEALLGRAQAYISLGMYEEATTDLLLLSVDNRTAEQFLIVGETNLVTGDLDEALFNYNRAVELNGTLDAAYFGRGRVYAARGNVALAENDFEQAIELNGGELDYRLQLIQLLLDNGQTEEALQQFDEALQRAPDDILLRLERARIYIQLEDYEQAELDLATVLDVLREEADAWLLLGDVYVGTGRPQDAQEAYLRHIALASGTPEERATRYVDGVPSATEEPDPTD
ncbi:MAG: tetratricopeptide repeat protein [Chloroflexota bacterium]